VERTHNIMKHKLGILPEYFKAIKEGRKKFEVRFNDRDYKENDILILQELDPLGENLTGNEVFVKVIYILKDFGLQEGYCILGIEFA